MRTSRKTVLAALACLLYLGGAAHAGGVVVYDNTAAASDSSDQVFTFGPLYDSFTSAATPLVMDDLKLILGLSDLPAGTVDIGLYSDSSTTPGGLIASLGSISDTSLSSSLATYDFPVYVPLAASTRYWIGLSSGDGSTAVWSWSLDTSGPGVASEFFANSNGVFDSTDGPYQMLVHQSVPEPSSVVLAGMGLAAVIGINRRFRSRRAA